MSELTDKLNAFVQYTQGLDGDEKGEAQVFCDRFFQAFGHQGYKEAGATLEMRIKKVGKGTRFADLVWKPVVLIEMKKRGVDLSKHYRQAFDYWTRLVPERPRYTVLCNFDEFWVYDFETQMDSPVDIVTIEDLPNRYGPLAFMTPEGQTPVFGNHQESVTRAAADKLVELFNSLTSREVDRDLAQRFTLQALLTLFAEDIGLLEPYFFARLLEDCNTPSDAYDLIGSLFVEMNTPGETVGGRFKGVDYFNGGLFANPARIELLLTEVELLKEAAKFDWSKVRPEIFGSLFEHSMGQKDRHAYGAHYTSAVDIMKIIGPTIVEPWREQINSASTIKDLNRLLTRISSYRVLDPACGSGNFLYIAYREIKRLEALIYEKLAEKSKKIEPTQRSFGFVTTRNFYGMDINPFAVELAKVTMMLAHKLAIDELHVTESALPLDDLASNFIVDDALVQLDGSQTPWPKADVIIGNPPFLGAKRLKPERGSDYVNTVRKAYPDVPGMADYCVYWFRRAHDELNDCLKQDPVSGRAGLVGTQNIRNNASRRGGLDYVCNTGTIVEAVDNQPWSGEANVHVSIANWVKSQDEHLTPKLKRLWVKLGTSPGRVKKAKGLIPAHKTYELGFRDVLIINSALSDQVDVSGAKNLEGNQSVCYTGQYPRHTGFMLRPEEADSLCSSNPNNQNVVHPFLIGSEMLTIGKPGRSVIDFQTLDVISAQSYPEPFNHLRREVLPHITALANEEREKTGKETGQNQNWLNTWWRHFRPREELINKLNTLPRYLTCSRVTKRPIFVFISSEIRPGDALSCFALSDDYSFGILQSIIHWHWFVAKCSKLKSDYRYTPESVFNTFPWPQSPTGSQIEAVAQAGVELRLLREESLQKIEGGLRALYRTLELPGRNPLKDAHTALDGAVMNAYGFSFSGDILQQLLNLNIVLTQRSTAGEMATVPGIPSDYTEVEKLISNDCITP